MSPKPLTSRSLTPSSSSRVSTLISNPSLIVSRRTYDGCGSDNSSLGADQVPHARRVGRAGESRLVPDASVEEQGHAESCRVEVSPEGRVERPREPGCHQTGG